MLKCTRRHVAIVLDYALIQVRTDYVRKTVLFSMVRTTEFKQRRSSSIRPPIVVINTNLINQRKRHLTVENRRRKFNTS